MANYCDECTQSFEEPVVAVFTRRPSDPTDLCCILWFCPACAERQGWKADRVFGATDFPGLATFEQADAWVEDYGQKLAHDPVLFLT
jgi:hypothetical protein